MFVRLKLTNVYFYCSCISAAGERVPVFCWWGMCLLTLTRQIVGLAGHCDNGRQWTCVPLQWDIAAPPIKTPSLKSMSAHHLDLGWPSDLLWPLEYGGCDGVWFLSLGLKGPSNLLEPWGCYAVRKPRLTGGGELEKQAACWSGRPGGTSLAVTADGGSEQGRGKATGQLGICQRSQEAVKVKWKVKVAQSCPTLSPMDYTVHGILQARILEWVAVPFSKGSSQPRDQTQVSCNAGRFFTSWATRKQGAHKWKETALVPMEKKWSGQKIQSARTLPQGKASSRARPCLSSILGRLREVRKLQKKWRNVWG